MLALLFTAIGLCNFVFFRINAEPPGMSPLNYLKIKNGKSKEDVEFLFGGPARCKTLDKWLGGRCEAWFGCDGEAAIVSFDEADKVIGKKWVVVWPQSTHSERFWAWFLSFF